MVYIAHEAIALRLGDVGIVFSFLLFVLKWNKYLLIGIVRTFLNDELKIEYTEKAYNKTDFIITLR